MRISDENDRVKFLEGIKCFAETDSSFPAGSQYPSMNNQFRPILWLC